MRIGIDLRALQRPDRFRGLGAYLVNLVSAFAQIDKNNRYVFFAWPGTSPLRLISLPSGFEWRIVELRRPLRSTVRDRMRNCFMRDIKISRTDVDVFLQPDSTFGRPRGGVPTVAVAYDLIPLVYWDRYYSDSGKRILRLRFKHGLSEVVQAWLYRWSVCELIGADRIIAISHATRQDLLRHFPSIDRQKIVVVHPACDPSFRPSPSGGRVLAKFGIHRAFLLYCGGTDFRKNVPFLLRVYDQVRKCGHHVQLVLVGKEFEREGSPQSSEIEKLITASEYQSDIIRTGFIETNDLVALYSLALSFVFPSLYEGFGLPILEAMACGCPVIAYQNSSVPEVAGMAGILLRPTDSFAAAIIKVVCDQNLRTRMISEGLKQAQNFSWEKSSRAILSVLEDAAR